MHSSDVQVYNCHSRGNLSVVHWAGTVMVGFKEKPLPPETFRAEMMEQNGFDGCDEASY
ncbi:hypothetical protein F9C07_12937 [Aspergillus flavus]|uniref:Uncharacterized protein n=1 Tax=Aspergillus flavus (strain ATCC 200026 / FGSC A1120 / IAM 13836 / NRRL 3357 / JCM 12722 / SRRC 167) TaxID=332952 RepID=A0A7U2N0I4_ASPFN|nr:hypothetical protein F9C07_12937 [Aspergillus flavus]